MKQYEITVRVTHDVAFVVEAKSVDDAKYEAMRRATALWDDVVDTPVIEVAVLEGEEA